MKIIFLNDLPAKLDRPFGVYDYDERFIGNPNYIDVRGIVKAKNKEWLDEVQRDHAQLSQKFLNYTRWWWVTSASRLDARPWGQEYLFKPLFFARAVVEWLGHNKETHEIILIGCDPMVALYLKEFKKDLALENKKMFFYPAIFTIRAFKYSLACLLTLFHNAMHISRYHLFRRKKSIGSEVLVLYELFSHSFSLTDARKYYYDSLFDLLNSSGKNRISYGCIEISHCKVSGLRQEVTEPIFFLLDNIGPGQLLRSIGINISLILVAWVVALRGIPCSIGPYTSRWFWPTYLFREFSRTSCLLAICTYSALSEVLLHQRYKFVVYPYEEKGIERAILFACYENNVASIGYAQHPQHSLAVALRDTHRPMSPKPSSYAVCGPAYVDYFESWAKKDRNSIDVWGSIKSSVKDFAIRTVSGSDRKVLLLLSHPHELRVFRSWLLAEKRLSNKITYYVRTYKAIGGRFFAAEMAPLLKNFYCIQESNGDLAEDIRRCNIAIFCATSAGLIAVNHGCLAIHVCLDDFFQINPCFDDLDAMLSCENAAQFARRLEDLRAVDDASINNLLERQRLFVSRIFSPIQPETIKKKIL